VQAAANRLFDSHHFSHDRMPPHDTLKAWPTAARRFRGVIGPRRGCVEAEPGARILDLKRRAAGAIGPFSVMIQVSR
jgi:hypothetical protein